MVYILVAKWILVLKYSESPVDQLCLLSQGAHGEEFMEHYKMNDKC